MIIYRAITENGTWYFVGTDGLHWRERCAAYKGKSAAQLADERTLDTEILWIGLELRGAVRVY